MARCEFTPLGGKKHRCIHCGYVTPPLRAGKRIARRCLVDARPATSGGPSTARKIATFASAVKRWIAAGSPTRSDSEVERIVSLACHHCPLFNGSICTHRNCGCRIQTPKQERKEWTIRGILSKSLQNKARMATEDCPDKCDKCGESRWSHIDGSDRDHDFAPRRKLKRKKRIET